jgi:bacteriorhodopsin
MDIVSVMLPLVANHVLEFGLLDCFSVWFFGFILLWKAEASNGLIRRTSSDM